MNFNILEKFFLGLSDENKYLLPVMAGQGMLDELTDGFLEEYDPDLFEVEQLGNLWQETTEAVHLWTFSKGESK
jgi:hypothetical protein